MNFRPPQVSVAPSANAGELADAARSAGVEVLLVRAGTRVCALRVTDVIETLRPLPVESVAGAPEFVRGASVLRGSTVPVVRLAALLGKDDGTSAARWVALRAGAQTVALEVDEVMGLRRLGAEELAATPPLLGSALREHADLLAVIDGELVAVVRAARMLPPEWAARWRSS